MKGFEERQRIENTIMVWLEKCTVAELIRIQGFITALFKRRP